MAVKLDTVGHAKLRAFLNRSKLTIAGLARCAGLTSMQVSHLVCGRRGASLEVAVALERTTEGIIRTRYWTESV